jgi:hypothetical protein
VTATKYSLIDIVNFIVHKTGCKENEVTPSCDIKNDLGCWGDDFHELIDEYSKKFNVDMTSYLWYFHSNEEGLSIGGIFIKPPYERVTLISVTPTILLDCANQGKWLLKYPEHNLPKRRYDILINQILVFLSITFLIYKFAR